MIDSYSQRIDWDSRAKTAQPAMQPDRNGTWVKLVDHVRIVRALEAVLREAEIDLCKGTTFVYRSDDAVSLDRAMEKVLNCVGEVVLRLRGLQPQTKTTLGPHCPSCSCGSELETKAEPNSGTFENGPYGVRVETASEPSAADVESDRWAEFNRER